MKKKPLLLALSAAASLQARGATTAFESFENNNAGDTLSTPLNGGTGWNGNWGAATSGGTLTASGVVSNATPVATGANNHLAVNLSSTTAGASLGIGRQLAGGAPTGDFSVSFQWRANSLANFGGSTNDRFEFFMANAAGTVHSASTNSVATEHSQYLFGVFGGNRGTSTGGNFAVYNSATVGANFDGNRYFNLGALDAGGNGTTLSLVAGTTYSFDVDVHFATQTWDVSVSDGVTTATSTGLNWWGSDANSFIAFGGRGSAAGEARSFSVDNISVIPEPGSFALLTLSGAGVLLRRRR